MKKKNYRELHGDITFNTNTVAIKFEGQKEKVEEFVAARKREEILEEKKEVKKKNGRKFSI